MLPSVDTYIHHEIEEKLNLILGNRYIIEEILSEIQPKVASNFMRAYAANKTNGSMENKRDVPIVYTLPQDKHTQQGAVYIGLKQGEETDPSLGNVEDSYAYKQQGITKEKVAVRKTRDDELTEEYPYHRLVFEVSREIGELDVIENMSFSTSDNVVIEGNKIYFAYDQGLLDLLEKLTNEADVSGEHYDPRFNVNYTPIMARGNEDKHQQGLKKGFSARESYSIVAISTNMDTVRCLDLIIKAIMIMMRENPEEQNNTLLQRLAFGQIEEIPVGTEATPLLLYGRETVVTYTSSYSLDVPLMQRLKTILLSQNFKEVGKDGKGQ